MLRSKASRWAAAPYLVWMVLFIVVPLGIVVWYALTNSDGQVTLANLTSIGRYASVFGRSLLLAAEATIICLVLAYPVGYFLSRLRANKQHIMLMLVMLPMWMNFFAAHLCVDDPAGKKRPDQQAVGPVRHRPL